MTALRSRHGLAWGGALDEAAWTLAWSTDEAARNEATRRLQATSGPALAEALAEAFRWAPELERTFVGVAPLCAALDLDVAGRARLAEELLAWRIAIPLVGAEPVPARLEAELRGVLGPEIERLGQPTQTTDWVLLGGAVGVDVARLLDRLDLSGDARWAYLADVEALLRSGGVQDALPLLGHRAAVVRTRAARRFEETPELTKAALRRAWRFAPSRAAPLRGDIEVPALPAARWVGHLVRWARRTHRQRDDRALRATLRLLTEPRLSSALTESARHHAADALIRTAKKDIRSQRAADLAQAMDALVRQVPFDEGLRPAPEDQRLEGEVWRRQHAPE